jgi:multiple sugar transport system permease protein
MRAVTEKQGTTLLTSPREGRLARLWKEIKANKVSYLFIAPYGILFLLFTIIPVFIAIGLSFTHYNMLQPPRWVGWENYLRLFLSDDVFLIAVKNTFVFAVLTGPLSYFASFLFAWFINELRPKIRAVFTLMLYAPSISGALFMIWTVMFSGDAYGYVNGFLLYWGFIKEPVQWLTDPKYMMGVVIVVVLWMSLGTSFLAFIAGLQGINPLLYEAGAVDGIRNRWQELFYITLPQMRGYLMFGAIMSITGSFTAAAQIIPLVGFPSTDYAGHTIVAHLIDYGNVRFEMGTASAIAVILFVTMVVVQRWVQRVLNKVGA